MQDEAFDSIRDRKLTETQTEHFLEVLKSGTVSTNVYLRRMYNFAVGTNWLPWMVLPNLHRLRHNRSIELGPSKLSSRIFLTSAHSIGSILEYAGDQRILNLGN